MNLLELLKNVPEKEMPRRVHPMLATLVDAPFDDSEYYFEIKYDGYRATAEIENRKVNLYSRNGNSFNETFPVIRENLKVFPKVVLDGEVVALDDNGMPSFELLQNYKRTGEGQIIYLVFDILWAEGHDLTKSPLSFRRQVLEALPFSHTPISLSEVIDGRGIGLFMQLKKLNFEGMMAKNKNSLYLQGERTRDWLKIKIHARQEAVIGGFTEPNGGRVGFGSLLLGVYEGDDFVYIGSTGTGFSDQTLAALYEKMEELQVTDPPFVNPPKASGVTWVKPDLVCEVKFQEWTKDGKMRQSVFLGLRTDKLPREVFRELPKKTAREVK